MNAIQHGSSPLFAVNLAVPHARPVAQALLAIGMVAAVAIPAPFALAAESVVPVLAREAGPGNRSGNGAVDTLNDPAGVAVRTSGVQAKSNPSGFSLYTKFWDGESTVYTAAVGVTTKAYLNFQNYTSYGYFNGDSASLSLPSGVVVADPPNASGCGMSVTATPGSGTVSLPSFQLNSESSCTFSINVKATTGGTKTLSPTFTGDFNDGPSDVTVTATSSDSLAVVSTVAGFSPGSVSPGQSSILTFTVGNPYSYQKLHVNGSISLGTLSASGSVTTTCTVDEGSPSVSSGTLGLPGMWVNSGGSCTVSLGVSSTTPGSYTVPPSTTNLTAYFGSGPVQAFVFNESGKAAKGAKTAVNYQLPVTAATLSVVNPAVARIGLSPASLNFGTGPVGKPLSPSQSVTISSTGDIALTLSPMSTVGPNASDYGFSSNCPGSLPVGAQCAVTVTFTPGGSGSRTATLQVPSGAGLAQVPLSGTGASATVSGELGISPATVGTGSGAAMVLKLSNANALPVAATWTITYPADLVNATAPAGSVDCTGSAYSAVPGGSSFTAFGYTIPANGSCTSTVTVTSAKAGKYHVVVDSGSITATMGSAPATLASAVSAGLEVKGPVASVSPTVLTFPPTQQGVSSQPLLVTLSNTGLGPLVISPSTISLSSFTRTTSCAETLAFGQNCTYSVVFTPSSAGTKTGSLTINTNAPGSPHTVSLNGIAAPPGPTVSKSFLPGSVVAGANATLTVSLSNPNSVPITSLGFTDIYPAGLTSSGAASNNCGGTASGSGGLTLSGGTLQANSGCQVSIPVSATTAGSYTNTIAAGAVTGLVGTAAVTNAAGASAVLQVTPVPAPTVAKFFSPGSVVAGANSTLTVSISNPNAVAITSLVFTDTFPTGLSSSGKAANNCGGAASGGSGLSLSGGTLQANGGCQVSIPVSATTAGSYTNTIAAGAVTGLVGTAAVSNSAVASAVLEVTPAPAPGVAFSPGLLNFGTVTINTVSGVQRATITNSGTAALNFSGAFGMTGPFSHASNCPASLVPTQGCTVDVTFAPTAVGPASGVLTVASNAQGSPHSLMLTGTGDPLPVPAVSLSPASLSFSGQTVATTSNPQVVTLSNSGKLALAISGIGTGGDFAQSNNCPASLAPQSSCPISVTFTPLVAGTRTGSLTVASNAPGSPHAAGLTGLGVAIPTPTVSVSPSNLAFPSTQLGTVSGTLLVQVRNTGNAQLLVFAVDIIGAGFTPTSNSCNVPVAAGGECAIGIVFAPPALGAASATLRITGNTPGGPTYVGLTGTGIPVPVATLTATPGALAFAEREIGTTSEVRTVAVSNTGTAAAALGGLGLTASDFAATTTCGSSLEVGAGCAVSVTFTPTAVGARSGTLAVLDSASNPLVTVGLSGRGAPLPVPEIEVSTTSITFGNTTMPGASPPQSFTVRNAGGAPLTIASLAVTGDFVVANGCTAPLAAGADCRIDVAFQPHVPGPRPGAISIPSNASNGTPTVNLSGIGCRLNFRTFTLTCQ